MDFISDNAGCIVSALIMVIPLLILVRWFLKKELEDKRISNITAIQKEILPQKLHAYERLALLIERVTPEALVLREQRQGMNSLKFHSHLLRVIRNEFEHNLAMQIYVTQKTWEQIDIVRAELLKLINSCAAKVNPESSSMELARTIIENSTGDVKYHFKKALDILKKDIELLYR